MLDSEILEFSSGLKRDADEIVSLLKLQVIANKYCECYQMGSSVMDLMVDEDIDFTCYEEKYVDIDKCFNFAKELVTTPTVDVLRIKNYLNNPDFLQFKVYIDPYKYKGRSWQIAFSFQIKTPELFKTEVSRIDWVKNLLTPVNKLTILKLKLKTREMGLKISGRYIYEAVLEHRASTIDELEVYLKSIGRWNE